MNRRVLFDSKEIRELFFQKVLESFDIRTWTELRKLFKIPKSMFEFYKNGKLTLPERLYLDLTNKLEEEDIALFNNKIKILNSNWGSVKGGKTTYSRYKEIFEEGRKKAILSRKREAADKFDINRLITPELAYFLGLFIGDGFTNKYQRSYMTELTGDKRSEEKFYTDIIAPLIRNLFNLNAHIRKVRNHNTIRFILYSKTLFKMITERFKISAGRKSHSVLIPEEILNSKPEIIKACLRGLYDAEGCVFFDKRQVYKKPYGRLELHMNNPPILKQVYELLNKFGIKSTLGTIKDNLRVTIYTEEQVKKFIKEISFSNPKHLDKLKDL